MHKLLVVHQPTPSPSWNGFIFASPLPLNCCFSKFPHYGTKKELSFKNICVFVYFVFDQSET